MFEESYTRELHSPSLSQSVDATETPSISISGQNEMHFAALGHERKLKCGDELSLTIQSSIISLTEYSINQLIYFIGRHTAESCGRDVLV